jgi:ectoine hydroxylase-related dioxygenase (phytanoyl-CoA dioxygenase family)
MMRDIKPTLESKEGYMIWESFIPELCITDFNNRLKDLYPVRASSSKKVYAERDNIKNLEDISVWWSQSVTDFPEVKKIQKYIDPIIEHNLPNLKHYASDCVFINSGSTWVNPHVDTPHRFDKWNYDKRLLGVQCIVSLSDLNENNGSTGLVPFSQKRDFDIHKCYSGNYDRWFIQNVKQHNMPRGSLLMYNCRVLHSSMPNNGQIERPALLFNYLDSSIIDEVSDIDNVWTSNGKRP